MSRVFDALTPDEQRQVEQEGYDMKNERAQSRRCGDEVEVVFRGKIDQIEVDAWHKSGRLMVRIRNGNGDSVIVPEDMVVDVNEIKQGS